MLKVGRNKHWPAWNCKMVAEVVKKASKEGDCGMVVLDTLSSGNHINSMFKTVYKMFTYRRTCFHFLT